MAEASLSLGTRETGVRAVVQRFAGLERRGLERVVLAGRLVRWV